MKKTLMRVLSYVLVAALAISGTVAYLQDEDSDVNVMTLGNVQIEQNEYQRAEGVAHNAGASGKGNGVTEGALVPYKNGQALYPAVPKSNNAYTAEATDLFYWGDYVYSGTAGNGLWNDANLSNVMDKMVFVKNTGKSDAYFRTLIAFECPEGMEYSQGSDKEFMMNTNVGETIYDWEDVGYITVEDVRYFVMAATYKMVLNPGNQSHPSLLQVVMTHNATNEDMELLGDTYEILVLSQAVQTAGFDTPAEALDTGFGDVTEDSAAEWFGGIAENTFINEPFYQNYDASQKVEIDGEGKEIYSYIESEAIDWGELGNMPNCANVFTNATVSNLSFTGTMMPVMSGYWDGLCNFNNTFNNVNIIGVESVGNAAGFSPAMIIYGNATLNNCNIYGTTTEMEGTNLYDVMTQIGHTTINGGKVGSFYMANNGTKLTVNGAEMDSIYAAGGANKKMTIEIGEGSVIGSIKLPRDSSLTIANGATVEKIIHNNVTYTQAEWMAR